MLFHVEKKIGIPYAVLAKQAAEVFTRHHSIEYPFIIQELPAVMAHFGSDLDRMLQEVVDPAREDFKRVATTYLKPYEGVAETLKELKRRHPTTPIVALTDAPRYVAMWKLNKLGLLHDFDAVYGLADPRIPTDNLLGRVKVDPRILLKHLQQSNFGFAGKIRILPDDYEKPGSRGLKTVLMDFEIDEDSEAKQRTFWIGDNLRKDVGLGKRVGVKTVWAKYGVNFDRNLLPLLNEFSPSENVHKNASLDPHSSDAPQADFVLEKFSEILNFL
jgi:phosphoglycolate phosphatase